MLPPLSLAGHAPPPVQFPVGLRSLLSPATHFLCLGLLSDLPLGFACPFGRALCPGYIYPFLYAVEAMTLSCWLLDPSLIRHNGVYCWAKGGLCTVLRFWCSLLDGLEDSLLFLGCSLSGWGFFLCAASLPRFLVRCFQACIFSCSFLPIAWDSSLVPTVSGRVRGLLGGGRRDGLLSEVVWLHTVG